MLKQSLVAAGAAALIVTGIAGQASAQSEPGRSPKVERIFDCRGPDGQPVLTLMNPRIARAALLDKTIKGKPVIVVSGKYLKSNIVIAVFAYYRKCASIALRHPAKRTVQHEAQADCWAVQTMARKGLITVEETRVILKSVYRHSGKARGDYALRCARANAQYIKKA